MVTHLKYTNLSSLRVARSVLPIINQSGELISKLFPFQAIYSTTILIVPERCIGASNNSFIQSLSTSTSVRLAEDPGPVPGNMGTKREYNLSGETSPLLGTVHTQFHRLVLT